MQQTQNSRQQNKRNMESTKHFMHKPEFNLHSEKIRLRYQNDLEKKKKQKVAKCRKTTICVIVVCFWSTKKTKKKRRETK